MVASMVYGSDGSASLFAGPVMIGKTTRKDRVRDPVGRQGHGKMKRGGDAMRGLRSHHAGLAAEEQVARVYDGGGMPVCARRWRGRSGEIDIVARDGDRVIFVEVKQSRTHDEAASHVTPRQMARIWNAASEFLAGEPRGQLTEVRIDVALVDGAGRISILENAYAA